MLKLVGVETCHCFTSLFSVFACKEVISKAAQEVQEEEEITNVREVLFQEQFCFLFFGFFLEYEDAASAFLKSLQQRITCYKCRSAEFLFSYYILSTSTQ